MATGPLKRASPASPIEPPSALMAGMTAGNASRRTAAFTAKPASPCSDEIVGSCILLNVAGQETTMHRISNGTLYLLDNPDQYRALRNDLSLMPNAIEEILRYSSVNALPRYATRDVRFGDHVIPEGPVDVDVAKLKIQK